MLLKKTFLAPFWWMLVMGVITGGLYVSLLLFLLGRGAPMSLAAKMSMFYLPAIMFVEAVMYWMIRKRIVYRRDAWNHLILFTSAYVFNIIVRAAFSVTIIMHRRVVSDVRMTSILLSCIFWAMIIVAHVFFIRVLIKAFSGSPAGEEAAEGVNLLDDVLD